MPERDAATLDAVAEAAAELGFPVVVKSAVPGAHKTETGGVALGLADGAAAREAAGRIGLPVIVQPMAGDGPELIAGSSRIRSSGRSSPSGRAARSRSSSPTRRSRSLP